MTEIQSLQNSIEFNEIFSEKLLPTEGAIPLLYDLGFQESGMFDYFIGVD